MGAELFNTAIETTVDLLHIRIQLLGGGQNVAAAAVLVSAFMAVLIGCFLLAPMWLGYGFR